jgi:hypothetical protein
MGQRGQDYTFIFDDVASSHKGGRVRVIKHRTGREYAMWLAVRDDSLLRRQLPAVPPLVADIIDLAAAVSVADRLAIRSTRVRSSIHVELPVRQPEFWNGDKVKGELERLLYWFTLDHWTFRFMQRAALPRLAELQEALPLGSKPREVALWSGGLDALAGLYSRLLGESAPVFTLFGTGSNDNIQHDQKEIAKAVALRALSRVDLIQVPIDLMREDSQRVRQSSAQRTRGFAFMLLGAACAYLQGESVLYIYENGVGALNLPYRASETGRDHAVSVHPLSLLYVGRFLATVFNSDFRVHNPFLLYTKAEMCQSLLDADALDLAWGTSSCDRRRRERSAQCGCCSSCLLRRQAFAVLGVGDHTAYGVLANNAKPATLGVNSPLPFGSAHLLAMLYQVITLDHILGSSEPWRRMVTRYPMLQRLLDETALQSAAISIGPDQILDLYSRYVHEWSSPRVRTELSRGLLQNKDWQGVVQVASRGVSGSNYAN